MIVYDGKKVGRSIASRRAALGMTQAELAKECGLSQSAIQGYESAEFGPSLKNAVIIANALGVTATDLLRIPN